MTRYFSHKKIKTFTQHFEVKSEADIESVVNIIYRHSEQQFREDGYVPVLDISPNHSVEYDVDKDVFVGLITMYTVYVGEREAWKIEGIEVTNSGRVYPSSLSSTKMKQRNSSTN